MRVAVAGGTGVVGGYVVGALKDSGHEPVILARSRGIDITTGAGLDAALNGVTAVIDVSNVAAASKVKSVAFFQAGTQHLLDAGKRAGVTHHVALSIVGIDRVEYGYYIGKRRQEELVHESGTPYSILRATQFHEFAGQILDRMRGPIAFIPTMRVQPVAAREVGEALAELAVGTPGGMTPELAGPEQHQLVDLARLTLRKRGSRKIVLPLPVPGPVGKAMRSGALTPAEAGPRGVQTFADWLAAS